MKAVLLAAGFGTRLRPITEKVPKCLVPIAGRPLLAYWLDALFKHGIDEVLVNLHHHANQVEEFIKINDNQKEVIINDPSYKSGTNIIEESQQLAFAVKIANKGYKVKIKGSTSLLNEIRILYKDLFVYELS